jgi:SAM-dependent methyltransferase
MGEWWESMFAGPWAAVQLTDWWEGDVAEAADRVERALALEPASAVLDVPCGVGVDATEDFVDEARRRARERGLEITCEVRDMRDLPWEEEFDAVVNFGGSFGYFDDDGNERFVRAVARTLRPGGRFLVDTPALESVVAGFVDKNWHRVDDTFLLMDTRLDLEASRVRTDWTFVRRGAEPETHTSSIRLYSVRELTELLRSAGFDDTRALTPELEPYGVEASRLLMVARRGG